MRHVVAGARRRVVHRLATRKDGPTVRIFPQSLRAASALLWVGTLAAGLSPDAASACSVCLAGDPIFSTQGASAQEAGSFSIYLEARSFSKTSGLGEPADEAPEADEGSASSTEAARWTARRRWRSERRSSGTKRSEATAWRARAATTTPGADARVRNAISPGAPPGRGDAAPASSRSSRAHAGGPNHALRLADFPLLVLTLPTDRTSLPVFVTDDVVSSAGTFGGDFAGSIDGRYELCTGGHDAVFARGGVRTRRVEPRNAPSVVNAVFSHRLFWDGRASNVFNGRNPLGERDGDGADLRARAGRRGKARAAPASRTRRSRRRRSRRPSTTARCRAPGAASPTSGGSSSPARPLGRQEVHPDDGVLGPLRDAGRARARRVRTASSSSSAFHPRLWSARRGPSARSAHGAPLRPRGGELLALLRRSRSSSTSRRSSRTSRPSTRARASSHGHPDRPLAGGAATGSTSSWVKAHCVDCHRGSRVHGRVGVGDRSAPQPS